MALLMLWPPLTAQAAEPTLKTATFNFQDANQYANRFIITAEDITLTVRFYGSSSTKYAEQTDRQKNLYCELVNGTHARFIVNENNAAEQKLIKSVKFSGTAGQPLFATSSDTDKFKTTHLPLIKLEDFESSRPAASTEYVYNTASGFEISKSVIVSATIESSQAYGCANSPVVNVCADKISIGSITITYYDADDPAIPKENAVTYGLDYANPIQYVENPPTDWTTANWQDVEGFAPKMIPGNKVLVKLGNTVTVFTATSSIKEGQPTVIIDPAKRLIGATAGVSFYTQLYSSDADDKLFRIEYLYNYKIPTYQEGYQRIYANLTNPTTTSATSFKAPNVAFTVQDTKTQSLTEANAKCVVKTSGVNDIFSIDKTIEDASAATAMCVAFDGIRVTYLSTTDAPVPTPLAPVVTIPTGATLGSNGVYKLLGNLDLTPKISANETSEGAKVVYCIDNGNFEPLPANGIIPINSTCILKLKTVTTNNGESGVLSYSFNKLDIANVENPDELADLAAGKTVRLNFPLHVLATGVYDFSDADKKVYHIYARDLQNNPVHIVSRLSRAIDTRSGDDLRVLVPGDAFKAYNGTDLTLRNQTFIPEGGAVGTLEFENGRPVVVLKDEAQDIDNLDFCYAGAAKSYKDVGADEGFVRFTYTSNPRNAISGSDFGRIVSLNVTYKDDDKFYVDGSTEPLDVRISDNVSGRIGFIKSYPNGNYTSYGYNPINDTKYTMSGLVNFDAANDVYYIMPRGLVEYAGVINVKMNEDSDYSRFVEAKDGEPARLYSEGGSFKLDISGATNGNGYYYVGKRGNSKGTLEVLPDRATTNDIYKAYSPEITLSDLPESGTPVQLDVFYTIGRSSETSTDEHLAFAADHYYIDVYDAVSGAIDYASIADLLQTVKANPLGLNRTYARISGDNIALAVLVNNKKSADSPERNSMVIKDIATLLAGDDNHELAALPLIFDKIVGDYEVKYQPDATARFTQRTPEPGDHIRELVFKVISDGHGNVIGDMTKTAIYYKSNAADYGISNPNYRPGLNAGDPLFKKYLDKITHTEDLQKAEEALLTADHLDKLVTIAGVKIAAQEPVVRSGGIDALADEPAQKTYVAKMAKDVRLEWSIFPSTDEKTVDHTIIDNIGADATYTLTGLVRADADGGHFIEVLDLDPVFGKKLAVCGHEHHVTYYDQDIDDVKLSPEQIGTVVELTGMNLAGNDADGFTTVTRQPVKLNFDNIASKTTGWNNQAKAAVEGNLPVKLMGTLTGAEDGSAYTLNVLTYDNLSSEAVDGNLALTFDGVTFDPEHTEFYSVGKLGYEAPDGVRVYYTMVDPAEMEFDESATDEQKAAKIAEKLAALPETLLDNAKGVVADRTVWVRLTTCTPGEAPVKAQVYEVTKRSTDVNTIAEVVKAQSADGKGVYHVRSPWLVTDKGTDRVIVTDGLIHAALHVSGQNASLPEVGSHLQEFAVAKGAAGMHPDYTYAFDLSGNDLHRVTVDAPATPVKAPEVENVASVSADSHGHLVGFTDVKLAGNKTAGFALKDALAADGGAATDLAVNNSLGISLDQMLDDDNEALYRIVGYAMPSAAGGMELWPAEVIRRTKIATVPVITLSAEKSLEPATVTISCADESVTIEYSTDGGQNWIEYTGAFSQSESAVIKARASKAYLDSSDEAAATFTRLYISPAPLASFKESDGMTKVTLGSSAAGAALGSYSIYYTLDGSIPTRESALYTAPIEVTSAGTVIKAILIDNDPEAVESAVKEWPVAFTPALSGDVTFEISQEAGKTVITISGPGTISYSFDGVTYVEYTDPIVITNDGQTDLQGTIHAFAQEDGKRPGAVKEESYRVSGIGSLSADGAAGVSVDGSTIVAPEGSMVFDITGRRVGLTGLRRGIYIVRLPDGKAVKVSVR